MGNFSPCNTGRITAKTGQKQMREQPKNNEPHDCIFVPPSASEESENEGLGFLILALACSAWMIFCTAAYTWQIVANLLAKG